MIFLKIFDIKIKNLAILLKIEKIINRSWQILWKLKYLKQIKDLANF